jgi:hypothetical protein
MKLIPMQKVSVVVKAGLHESLLKALNTDTDEGIVYCAVQSVREPVMESDCRGGEANRLLLEFMVDAQGARELLSRVDAWTKEFDSPQVMVTDVQCSSTKEARVARRSSYVAREIRWGDYIITI